MLKSVSSKAAAQQVPDDKRQKKRIVNLNKNVMSIALPYLPHDELLLAEQTNKQMAIFVNYWPVWRNIYYEQHLVNPKIPKEVKDMTQAEQDN